MMEIVDGGHLVMAWVSVSEPKVFYSTPYVRVILTFKNKILIMYEVKPFYEEPALSDAGDNMYQLNPYHGSSAHEVIMCCMNSE